MLKNYFKIAIAVLLRRKFFTFVSLFGISFTLAIIMLVAAMADNVFSAGYPDSQRDRELYVSRLELRDSAGTSNISGGPSFYFIDHYVSRLKTPEKIAVMSGNTRTNSFLDTKKLEMNLKYTNADFWGVFAFRFLEGKPYNQQQIQESQYLAVISEDTRDNYFGKNVSAVGKYIETDNTQYRVIGVIQSAPSSSDAVADMYVPYTLTKENLRDKDLVGGYSAVLLLHSRADIDKMKKEFNQMVAKVPSNHKDLPLLYIFADTYLQSFARHMPFGSTSTDAGVAIFLMLVALILFLFLLLPTINLININISRILDRASEIGVRKAFGASAKTLVYQFIVENLILTFLGGIIGTILSYIILGIVNSSNLLENTVLVINWRLLFFSCIVCLFFGILSGVYPAWRMSKLQIVDALKAK